MHKVNFFPLGNADCCRIDLENGKRVLVDYAHVRDAEDQDDLRIDLAKTLRDDLDASARDRYEVVAFTHLDDDHVSGAAAFFWFEHAKKYQDDDRIRIRELWVPAAAITEEGVEGDSAVIRAEARHRLRNKNGIRVFSRPAALKDWLEDEGIALDDVRHLITDAGQIVPGFSIEADGVEFFAHSPFARRQDAETVVDRNLDSIVVQLTFVVQGSVTKLILGSDVDHTLISDIVQITCAKQRAERLEWDVFKLPHHCSFTALGPEKGENETAPVPDVAWLFERQGRTGALIVSTSSPIPSDDDDPQPPHRQAANYYKRIMADKSGEFKVTMEHPKPSGPDTLTIRIDARGGTLEKSIPAASAAILTHRAPRAG